MMKYSFFIAGSMYLGWILSPEALVLVSNYAGQGGKFGVVALLASLLLCFFGVIVSKDQRKTSKSTNEIHFIVKTTELAAQGALLIFMSTGMLVTAGFTFNETFVYWFPNFGFSGILLAVIVIIHLLGGKAVGMAQKFFVALAALGFLSIIIAGLLSHSELSQNSLPVTHTAHLSTSAISLLAGALLFYTGIFGTQNRLLRSREIFYIGTCAALLLVLWQIVALKHIPQDRLVESTIPYILVAREVLGQAGRILMGITIIAGACAATNAFMSMATKAGSSLVISASSNLCNRGKLITRLLSLLFSSIIGLSMALGLAGDPTLESYIYGALLLWLLSSGVQLLTRALRSPKNSILQNILTCVTPTLFLLAFVFLTVTHEDYLTLVIFITLALCLSLVFTTAMFFLGKKYNQQPFQRGN